MAQLYEALLVGDGRSADRAVVEVLARMKTWARSELRRRGIAGGADLQSESIAHSAMGLGLHRLLLKAHDAEHFEALLRTALKHKLLDRLKRGGAAGRVRAFADFREDGDSAFDPHAPRSESDHDARQERSKFRHLEAVLTAKGALTAEQWSLVEAHLVRDRTLGEIATELGIGREAAKQRYATVRRRALCAICDDVEPKLNRETRLVARQIFVERQALPMVADASEISEADVIFVSLEEIIPALFEAYGSFGTSIVGGLLARA